MIQRVQSIFLFFSFVLLATMLFMPFAEITDNSAQLVTFDAYSVENMAQNAEISNALAMAVLIAITAAISLITIFLYNNRMLQMRLGVYNILVLVGTTVMLYVYPNYIADIDIETIQYQISAMFPVIAIILTILANRAIRKDENKIKAADRIR